MTVLILLTYLVQEIKVWSCESWDCIQTIRFEPSPTTTQPMMFKAALDLSARYLLLSNIYQKIVYVLQLQPVRLLIYLGLHFFYHKMSFSCRRKTMAKMMETATLRSPAA